MTMLSLTILTFSYFLSVLRRSTVWSCILSHGPNHLVLAKYATPHSAVAKDRQEVREWRIVKESTVMRIVRETREERQKK